MPASKNQLRTEIRSALEELYTAPVNEHEVDEDSTVGDWYLFQEFAYRVLEKVGYKGDFYKIVTEVTQHLEKYEGWEFD